jgi:hypothetical protein
MSNSLVVYRGPSEYAPRSTIRAVLVLKSTNRKTGNMAQLHILHDRVEPHTAQRTGRDQAVCGGCPLRPSLDGGCYVVTCQGPLSAWRATQRQPVATWSEIGEALQGRSLRLGAYGDPAALPGHLIAVLSALVHGGCTGYTHGWRTRPDLKPYCMASTHGEMETLDAQASGWRTCRMMELGGHMLSQEIQCPNESNGIDCADCLLCRGASLQAKSITIPAHGFRVKAALRVIRG